MFHLFIDPILGNVPSLISVCQQNNYRMNYQKMPKYLTCLWSTEMGLEMVVWSKFFVPSSSFLNSRVEVGEAPFWGSKERINWRVWVMASSWCGIKKCFYRRSVLPQRVIFDSFYTHRTRAQNEFNLVSAIRWYFPLVITRTGNTGGTFHRNKQRANQMNRVCLR